MSFSKRSRSLAGGIYLLLTSLFFRAQATEKVTPYFSHLRTESGLSHNKVNCILQDKRGFIWIGTEDGLNRYDGKYYSLFNAVPGDSSCISGNIITGLAEDTDGVLWISTADGGLTEYNYRRPAGRQFRQLKHHDRDRHSLPDNNISKMIMDDEGYLWLATGSHSLIRYNKKTGSFDSPVKDGRLYLTSICLDSKGTLWGSTPEEGLLKLNTHTLQYTFDLNPAEGSMTGIFEDSRKTIWYGQSNRMLHCLDAATGKDMVVGNAKGKKNVPQDEMVCFAEDKAGHLWMGGRYSGVYMYDPTDGQFAHFFQDPLVEGSIVDDHINCVYIDRSGIVWIGTNKGVSYYNPLFEPFAQTFLPASKNDIEIYDFYKDAADSCLWIATSDGLFIQRPGQSSFEHRRLSYKGMYLAATKFFRDMDGTFYLGTDYTLFIYDRKANRLSLPENTEPASRLSLRYSKIFGIRRDTIGGRPALAVTSKGYPVLYYDLVQKKWEQGHKDVLSPNGRLWEFITGEALKGWQLVRKLIPGDMLYDVQEDRQGNLWISTYGNGLNFYDARAATISHIKMSSDLTEGIQTDDKGDIWMICNGHLHKYAPATRTYSCYDLPSARRNGIKGYMYRDNEGNMYAAGMNYYISFRPETVTAINMQPSVWLTDLKIENRSNSELLEDSIICLKHEQDFFSIEFSAPEFSGNNLDYSYQLVGADKEWIESGKRNYASYSDLRPGEYLFRVKASNWRGCESNKITTIRIYITPPIWRTWWFYVLAALFMAGIFYIVYRYRIREFLKRQSIRNRIALDLHDNIGATLSSISIYSQVARVYQDQQDGRQLRDVLDRIDKTAGEAINEMSDMVWAINPKNDDMGSIVGRMQSYAAPLCAAKSVALNFTSAAFIDKLNLGMNQRKNLYFIYKEAINNALKYAGCTRVSVQLILENFIFRLIVKDNGKGFDIDALREGKTRSLGGNGLYNMGKRAAEIKAALLIDSRPGEGTTIELSFRVS